MADERDEFSAAQGRITHGPEAHALVERTLEFIRAELPRWRDRSDRHYESAEERLNAQLCKHLNAAARRNLPAVQFHHEEKQTAVRRVDVSAGLTEGGFIGTTYYSIDDPFIVIEGKRLPTPGGMAREREYVSGGEARTGGIQRFKLGLHGANVSIAGMVGYIQKGTSAQWRDRINSWIGELADSLPLDEKWTRMEELTVAQHDKSNRVMSLKSKHSRSSGRDGIIELRHFWLEMPKRG